MHDSGPPRTGFYPISIEDIIAARRNDRVCTELRRSLNKEERLSFVVDDNGSLVGTRDKGNQIATPHSLKERILYIDHY